MKFLCNWKVGKKLFFSGEKFSRKWILYIVYSCNILYDLHKSKFTTVTMYVMLTREWLGLVSSTCNHLALMSQYNDSFITAASETMEVRCCWVEQCVCVRGMVNNHMFPSLRAWSWSCLQSWKSKLKMIVFVGPSPGGVGQKGTEEFSSQNKSRPSTATMLSHTVYCLWTRASVKRCVNTSFHRWLKICLRLCTNDISILLYWQFASDMLLGDYGFLRPQIKWESKLYLAQSTCDYS